VHVASSRSTDAPSQHLLPDLREVQIAGMAVKTAALDIPREPAPLQRAI
jgi:hypothetical protein